MLQRLIPLVLAALCVASPAHAVDKVACRTSTGAVTTCPGNATLNGTLTANGLTVPGGLAVQGFGAAGTPTGDVLTVQGDPAGTPVPVSGTVTASGGATSANQTNGTQKTQVVDASGNVQPAGDGVSRPIYQARVGASAFQLLTGLTAGTTLRSGVGTLRKMCVFIPSSGGTGGFYVYDNTAASGTAIVSLFTTTSTCYDIDARFATGLTVQMTTAAATVLMTWDTY